MADRIGIDLQVKAVEGKYRKIQKQNMAVNHSNDCINVRQFMVLLRNSNSSIISHFCYRQWIYSYIIQYASYKARG